MACGPSSGATLQVFSVNADPAGTDSANLNDEYIDLFNSAATEVQLAGWVVRDETSSHQFQLSPGFSLPSKATVRLHTGCGVDTSTDLFWCASGGPVWNNDGDTIFVLDLFGNIIVSETYVG